MTLRIDSIISNRYHLIRLIATGGMGQVWEAIDQRLDRRVAIKVLKAEYSSNEEFITRFRVEAKTTAALNNSGIAGIFDYGETPDESVGEGTLAYLVMELVDGEPLSAILNKKKTLSVDNTLDILEQTATALQAAHNVGLVHRDVKPGNILLTASGEVKITDFGIAKAADAAPLTQTGTVMGTAQYISPEQAMGQDATSASDVYALAIVGYEALSGRRPFVGDSPVSIAMQHINDAPAPLPKNIPLPVRNLLQHALEKNPQNRYKNGLEFARAIRKVRIGSTLPAPTPTSPPIAERPTPKNHVIVDPSERALPVHTGVLASSSRANIPTPDNNRNEHTTVLEKEKAEGRARVIIGGMLGLLLILAAIGVVIILLQINNGQGHNPLEPGTSRGSSTPETSSSLQSPSSVSPSPPSQHTTNTSRPPTYNPPHPVAPPRTTTRPAPPPRSTTAPPAPSSSPPPPPPRSTTAPPAPSSSPPPVETENPSNTVPPAETSTEEPTKTFSPGE